MFGVCWISKALMDVQHQERTCQQKFPPKFIETESLDSVVSYEVKWTVYWTDFGTGNGKKQRLWSSKAVLVRYYQRQFKKVKHPSWNLLKS